MNARHRQQVEDQTAPDANEEYFLYQTLVGAWPLETDSPEKHARLRGSHQGLHGQVAA